MSMTWTATVPSGYSYVAKSGVRVTSTVQPSGEGSVWAYAVWYYYARAKQMLTGWTPC